LKLPVFGWRAAEPVSVSITDGLFVAGRLLGVNQKKARQKKARCCDRAFKQEVEANASRIMLI
jgi:hypothetical protein